MIRRPPRSPLFPYTPLFRSDRYRQAALLHDDTPAAEEGPVTDDRLRMVFTCCHPALSTAAQVALTLRLLGGLTTAEIAAALDRKSTRLNSSHANISYAVFCL